MGLCLARRTNASTAPSDTRTDGSQRIDSYLSLEAHAGCTIVGERTRTLRERQAVGGVRTLQPHKQRLDRRVCGENADGIRAAFSIGAAQKRAG